MLRVLKRLRVVLLLGLSGIRLRVVGRGVRLTLNPKP